MEAIVVKIYRSDADRERLILAHLPLVKKIAAQVIQRLPANVNQDDLVQAGLLGLFDAITKYDLGKKVQFGFYAKYRIKGAMIDSLRRLDWGSRDVRKRHRRLEAAAHDLSAKFHRRPTMTELADKLGMKVARVQRTITDFHATQLLSSSSRADYRDERPLDVPDRAELRPDALLARKELDGAMHNVIKTLPVRHQTLLSLYYVEGLTMRAIGRVLGVEESRISQIHKVAIEKIARILHSSGIHSSKAY